MNSKAKYISPGQIMILFGAAGSLYAGIGEYGTASEMLANAVLSAIITALLAIPLCIFSAGHSGEDMGESIAKRGKPLGIIAGILLVVYFISGAGFVLGKFGKFAAERVFPEGNIYLCIALTGLVCIYAAHTGAQAISRMTTLIFALFLLSMAMLLIGGWGDLKDFSLSSKTFAPKEISFGSVLANGEMTGIFPIFTACVITASMLSRNAGKGLRKGLYGGMAALLAASAAIITSVWAILGDFTQMTEYPALDAAVYCGRRFTFSFHGLFYSLWIIAAAALLSMLAACGGQALTLIFPKIKYSGAIAALAALIIALIEAEAPVFSGNIFKSPVFSAFLLIALPFLAEARSKRQEAGKAIRVSGN